MSPLILDLSAAFSRSLRFTHVAGGLCCLQTAMSGPGPHKRPEGGPLVSSSSTSPWMNSSSSSVLGPQMAAAMLADFRKLKQVRTTKAEGVLLLQPGYASWLDRAAHAMHTSRVLACTLLCACRALACTLLPPVIDLLSMCACAVLCYVVAGSGHNSRG